MIFLNHSYNVENRLYDSRDKYVSSVLCYTAFLQLDEICKMILKIGSFDGFNYWRISKASAVMMLKSFHLYFNVRVFHILGI